MGRILVVGSANTDMVVRTERFPSPGETVMGGSFHMFPGGKGANQAVAAARMGSEVALVCSIGDDVFGRRMLEGFKAEGIGTGHIRVNKDQASGTALIMVDGQGENEIVVVPGANEGLLAEDIAGLDPFVWEVNVLLLQLEIPLKTVVAAARAGHSRGSRVILNPAPACPLPEELYGYLYLITPNETEAGLLTGVTVKDEASAARAADVLLDRGVGHVVITMGAAGAYFKGRDGQLMVGAPAVEAVDTTAAGDVFNGVLATAIAEGIGWDK